MPLPAKPFRPISAPSRTARLAAAILSATALSASLAGTPAWAQEPAPVAAKPPTVTVVKAETGSLVEHELVTGTMRPREEARVTAEVNGLAITEILVEAGDHVTKGQVLARLSSDTAEATVAQSAAQIERARAAIAQGESQVTEAESTLDQTRKAFARTEALTSSGVASKQTFDQRKSEAEVAAARLEASKRSLEAARADLTLAEAQAKANRIELERTEIKAPVAGIVSRRDANLGAVVGLTSGPLFTIIENGDIELAADVAETAIAKLRVGQKARVWPAGFREPIAGTVRLISPEVDSKTRLGSVRIALPPVAGLTIGAFGRAEVDTATRTGVIVPLSAVLYGPGGPSVQVAAEGKIETRPITIGLVSEGRAEIAEGIAPGEQVVATSGTFLRNGDRVTPVVAQTVPAPSAPSN
ncbi:efflux RND transporter periplasmic adaptor subunit [Segnochrobactrum spirostomi]|nr:efflux RND transporter periplasmic adaptor subunit [Segnochrobactrum spirostomi]